MKLRAISGIDSAGIDRVGINGALSQGDLPTRKNKFTNNAQGSRVGYLNSRVFPLYIRALSNT